VTGRRGLRNLPPGTASYQLFPDPRPQAPQSFDLAVPWTRDPAPQGSKRWRPIWRNAGNGPPDRKIIAMSRDGCKELAGVELTEQSAYVGPWRAHVVAAARRRYGGAPAMDGPLTGSMIFTVHRPAYHYGTGRNAGRLKPDAPAVPDSDPDLSKLLRAVEDALTDAGVIADDGRIWRYDHLARVYPGHKPPAGWSLPAYALHTPGVFIHLERT
jgi:Holliday junction resolvase RusA-like endonuclease